MKKITMTLLGVGLAGLVGVNATPLTPQQALSRAQQNGVARAQGENLISEPVYTVNTVQNSPAAYVFVPQNGQGFRILSANDVAYPVLGYSDSGIFDPANIPAELKWWLNEYASQIQLAEQKGFPVAAAPESQEDWHAIAPLVKSKWDQGEPYNIQCPTPKNSDQHCYTGCVATSMAQVMNYFKYPEIGEGSISYKPAKLGRTIMMVFSKEPFDWDHMLDNYVSGAYTDEEANAVAYLMKACGYSVMMNYGTDASGAVGSSIGESLKAYFKYDEGTRSEERVMYSMSDWTQKIYNNLDNIGPVIINGRDFDGSAGHSFICDGYDGQGYFHFNWGWSGISDGYYTLNALNPDAMGIGGYGGGFNNGQNAIFGIQPPTGQTYEEENNILQYGNMIASVSGSTITVGSSDYSPCGWGNPFGHKVTGYVGLSFQNTQQEGDPVNVSAQIANQSQFSLSDGSYFSYPNSSITAQMPELENGAKYKMTLVFSTDAQNWVPVKTVWGYNNFVYITKNATGYEIEVPAKSNLKVEQAEIASELFFKKNTLFRVTYKNDSQYELSQGVVPRLYRNGTLCMEGSGVLVTVDANSTEEKEFISRFNAMNGYNFTGDTEFDFCLFDPTNNVMYGNFGKVTMKTAPSMTTVMQTRFEIEDAELEYYEYGDTKRKAYKLESTDNFVVDLDYMVRLGYFDGRIRVGIYECSTTSAYDTTPVIDEIYSVLPFLSSGQTGTAVIDASFPDAKPGVLYNIRANYTDNSSWKNFGSIYFFTGASGVKDVEIDSETTTAQYFNLQGMPVENPAKGDLLIKVTGEKSEKIIY